MSLVPRPQPERQPSLPSEPCPSCGQRRLRRHCTSVMCGWALCGNDACRSYGIPDWRWVDMRPKRPA